jgi:hypothetical protein
VLVFELGAGLFLLTGSGAGCVGSGRLLAGSGSAPAVGVGSIVLGSVEADLSEEQAENPRIEIKTGRIKSFISEEIYNLTMRGINR